MEEGRGEDVAFEDDRNEKDANAHDRGEMKDRGDGMLMLMLRGGGGGGGEEKLGKGPSKTTHDRGEHDLDEADPDKVDLVGHHEHDPKGDD